jgi:hypothetical protein
MYWHFAALGVLPACIMLRLFYRLATPPFADFIEPLRTPLP